MTEGNVATPFLEIRSFVREDSEVFASEAMTPALGSPFVSVYEIDGQSEFVDPRQEAYSTLVQELYDEELDEALFELLAGARGLHEEHLVSGPQSIEGERLLQQHFNQLIREAEATVSAFEREFGSRDAGTLSEGEVDAFAERYSPAAALTPEFEDFLGKWKKKIAGVVKKAAGLVKKGVAFAAKLGLGPVLDKIKALVKPLLNKVLQMAIGKLPEPLRPAAEKLAEKIFGPRTQTTTEPAAPTDPATAVQEPAGQDVTQVQQEFDEQLASLFMANDEVEMELEVARARSDDRQPAIAAYADLDQARERFIQELDDLREGEDPAPVIQNFLPAVLPALKLGVRLIGRPKVVGFLANLLGKVIAKLIGPEAAPALSRAIVDAGLKMISLEVSPQDEARAAASSVAATVEEAARRVSALPDYVLDNQELLEGFALEAFEQAAAANLPPVLSEAVYRERPDLVESQSARTCWVMLPLRRRKRYKKCGRVFKVRISPFMADEIESFEGPLADYLQEQLGVEEGAEVEAEVHLYETLPGTTLPDIAREESETPAQLHPLTPKAAGLLLGEPRLGRNLPPGTGRMRIGVGQRLYRLSIPGRRLLMIPGAGGRPQPRRTGGMKVVLDSAKDEVRVRIFLSEVKAQRLAVRLRRQSHAGTVAAGFQKYIGRRLPMALPQVPGDVTEILISRLQESLVGAFAEFVKGQAQRIIAASEDTADGITLKFTISRFPGLQQLGKAGAADAVKGGAKPDVRIEVFPGLVR